LVEKRFFIYNYELGYDMSIHYYYADNIKEHVEILRKKLKKIEEALSSILKIQKPLASLSARNSGRLVFSIFVIVS